MLFTSLVDLTKEQADGRGVEGGDPFTRNSGWSGQYVRGVQGSSRSRMGKLSPQKSGLALNLTARVKESLHESPHQTLGHDTSWTPPYMHTRSDINDHLCSVPQ